jgi:cytochrome P450 family 724 subfamily B polypeptide 1
MLKHLLNINPDEPIASKILENFEKYIKGFISLPLYIPGTTYFKAVKVLILININICILIQLPNKCVLILI